MRINANIAAINASRNLMVSNNSMSKSLEKLSSGYRVNRAADDAAGLSISEGLRAEIRGNTQAQRNAQDGISYIQTTEGALTEVHSMLQRMRELAVQAANGGTGDAGVAEQAEVDSLLQEITDIGTRTTFSNNPVFADYSTSALSFQVGAHASDTLTALNTDFTLDPSGAAGVFGASGLTVDLTSTSAAATALADIDAAISAVSTARGTLGAVQNRLEHTVANLGVAVENLTASESRIRDVDMATEMVNFTRSQILSQAGTSMLAQANQAPQSILTLLRG
jgi:flagellin